MLKNTSVGHALDADSHKIGGFLVRIGAMQPWQLEKVLRLQRYGDTRLFGEIAIELRYIEDAALKLYVDSHSHESERPFPVCTGVTCD